MVKIKATDSLLRNESANSQNVREDRVLIGGKFYPLDENTINEYFII